MSSEMSDRLQAAYNTQYSDSMTDWRSLCARYKAENIRTVCQNHSFDKVLECGAGEGSILQWLESTHSFGQFYAVEISDTGIEQIRQRDLPRLKEIKKFDGYQIPYEDACFDMAYCSHVLEHVEHPRLLLRELRRVSRFQVFEVPLDYAIGVDHQVKSLLSYGHINVFTPALLKLLLKSEGYTVLNEHLAHTSNEILRYNWYHNQAQSKSLFRELYLTLRPVAQFVKRGLWGKRRYHEYGYATYTCLTQPSGELAIFQPSV